MSVNIDYKRVELPVIEQRIKDIPDAWDVEDSVEHFKYSLQ